MKTAAQKALKHPERDHRLRSEALDTLAEPALQARYSVEIHCCLSMESRAVGVAQYRAMLGVREHSAPTDAPTDAQHAAARFARW